MGPSVPRRPCPTVGDGGHGPPFDASVALAAGGFGGAVLPDAHPAMGQGVTGQPGAALGLVERVVKSELSPEEHRGIALDFASFMAGNDVGYVRALKAPLSVDMAVLPRKFAPMLQV